MGSVWDQFGIDLGSVRGRVGVDFGYVFQNLGQIGQICRILSGKVLSGKVAPLMEDSRQINVK